MQDHTRVCFDFPFPDERVFRYQAMQDILHHLVNNPFEQFTQKELASIAGVDVSSVSRSVELLDQLGVLDIEDERPAKIRMSQEHHRGSDPLFAVPQAEYRTPIRAFLDELRTRVDAAADVSELIGVVLFGSVARGTADRSSDIDLLVIVDGDATYGRRIGAETARDLEEQSFEGDRYQFEVLVETPASVASHGEKVREIFDEGIVLERTDSFRAVRDTVYRDEGAED